MKPLHVLGMLALAYVAGICTAPQDNTEADALRAQIQPLLAVNDSLTVRISDLAYVADSLQQTYAADSVAWQAERNVLLAQADSASTLFNATATQLRAIGDSTVVQLTADLERARAEEIRIRDELIVTLESERDALLDQRGALMQAADEMRQQIHTQAQIIDHQQAINRAIASQQHTFRDEIGRYAVGALIGAVVWEMAR